MINITGTPDKIIDQLHQQNPNVNRVLAKAQSQVPFIKRQIAPFQGAALFSAAAQYNFGGAQILEIGTAYGYSAALLAEACPKAHIITLNPDATEAAIARKNLAIYSNVEVVEARSWDYLKTYVGPLLDVVFVDGDHKRVRLDLPWWDWLRPGGIILFHDYSPAGTYRECPPVYEAVNEFARLLGQELDVLVVDDGGVGMAGFVKKDAKTTRQIKGEAIFALARCHAVSVLSYAHIEALYHLAEQVRDLDGDIVECGVTNGGSALALYLGAKKAKAKRKLWLYDTFDGMPRPGPMDSAKAHMKWEQRQKDWCRGDMGSVMALAKELKVPESALQFREGDFYHTLASVDVKEIALLHVDATLYQSTKLALETLYPMVGEGGIITVSGGGHWSGVRAATEEFFNSLPNKPITLGLDGNTNLWWRK